MTIRASSKTVTFEQPFILKGFDAAQPAGSYVVATEEELLDSVSLPAYRRLSTSIELHAHAGNARHTEIVTIDPDELDAALARDAVAVATARMRTAVRRLPRRT